jgi:hypothetical protein
VDRVSRRIRLLLAACAVAIAAPGAALGPVSDAPAPEHGKLATGDATPVGAGMLELELGYAPSFGHEATAAGSSAWGDEHALAVAATYGLSDHLDARLAIGFARVIAAAGDGQDGFRSAIGLADSALGLRWRFLSSALRALEVALVGDLVLPTGRRASGGEPGLSQAHWSGGTALVATKDWGRATANLELRGDLPIAGDAGARRGGWRANAAAGHQLRRWLQPVIEVGYEGGLEAVVSHRAAITWGAVMPLESGYRIVLGVSHDVWARHVGRTTSALLAVKMPL